MPQNTILLVMGVVFIVLGAVFYLWGRGEERSYYNSISSRADVREYLEKTPWRPEPKALKIGGWVTVIVGLLLLGMSFWL